jgi:hypothetical protein
MPTSGKEERVESRGHLHLPVVPCRLGYYVNGNSRAWSVTQVGLLGPGNEKMWDLAWRWWLTPVILSYSRGRNQEDHCLKPAWADSSQDPILKIPNTKQDWQSGSSGRVPVEQV